MTKKKEFVVPEGYIDPKEVNEIMRAAREKRQNAEFRFFYFSKTQALEKWKNGGGIMSGVFNEVRRCFTVATFSDEKPETFPDYKRVGKAKVGANIDFIGGINEEMYNAGVIGGIKKKGEEKHFYAGPGSIDRGGVTGVDVGRFGLPVSEEDFNDD